MREKLKNNTDKELKRNRDSAGNKRKSQKNYNKYLYRDKKRYRIHKTGTEK